jgi:hypothetical protein
MGYPFCEKTNCVNYKKGRCILKNPEKSNESCLHFEDTMDSLRLKVNAFKGALRRE